MKRRMHPATRATNHVTNALNSLCRVCADRGEPITLADVAVTLSEHEDYLARYLLPALRGGYCTRTGDLWYPTADGWDRCGGYEACLSEHTPIACADIDAARSANRRLCREMSE